MAVMILTDSRDVMRRVQRCMSDLPKTAMTDFIAAEACYHMLGGSENWQLRRAVDEIGHMHWWLVNRLNGTLIDPTATDYASKGKTPPYKWGEDVEFEEPSEAARSVMSKAMVL